MPPALQFLVLTFAGWVNRHQDDLIAYLREENRVLREHLGPRPLRLTDAQRRRLAVRGQKLGRCVWMQVAGIVTPDTILRWYRRLIAQTYDGSARHGRGRPMTRRDVAARVVRMAVENPQWGYTRIRGALSNLGHEIARTTVKRILHDHGIDPAVPTENLIRTVRVTDRADVGPANDGNVSIAAVHSVNVDEWLASFGRSSGRRAACTVFRRRSSMAVVRPRDDGSCGAGRPRAALQ